MTDISGVTLGKKEDGEKEKSPAPTSKEGEKALTGQSNITNTSNKKAKEMCIEMNKNNATANLPPYDDDSRSDKSVIMKKMTRLHSHVAQQSTPSTVNPKRKTASRQSCMIL
eukprot:6567603-Ditylum_brightwellii.AAC.1